MAAPEMNTLTLTFAQREEMVEDIRAFHVDDVGRDHPIKLKFVLQNNDTTRAPEGKRTHGDIMVDCFRAQFCLQTENTEEPYLISSLRTPFIATRLKTITFRVHHSPCNGNIVLKTTIDSFRLPGDLDLLFQRCACASFRSRETVAQNVVQDEGVDQQEDAVQVELQPEPAEVPRQVAVQAEDAEVQQEVAVQVEGAEVQPEVRSKSSADLKFLLTLFTLLAGRPQRRPLNYQPNFIYETDSSESYSPDSSEIEEYTLDSSGASDLSQARRDNEVEDEQRALEEGIAASFVQRGEELMARTLNLPEVPEATPVDALDTKNTVCVLCQDRLFNKPITALIPCGHNYHSDCVQLLTLNKFPCSLCKGAITSTLPLKL